ncbi:hypothetical protein HanRHA438_Chr17g0799491 [Helianthus annuus]|nr:hypothetical protein HanRHA438_Chr17g0799491 [Helianthus annuus]
MITFYLTDNSYQHNPYLASKNLNMSSYGYSYDRCSRIGSTLGSLRSSHKELWEKISLDDIAELHVFCEKVRDMEKSDRYSKPMVWIGVYIAIASFLCTLAMTADMLYYRRIKKLWYPCKYFSLNATSLTVITIAVKLPVDLTSEMPGYIDQSSKVVGLAFMCTIMANLMPSLASMDSKARLANVTGLAILVITMIVNVFIQINTSVIEQNPPNGGIYQSHFDFVMVAYLYMFMILLLLIIIISSCLTIPTTTEILESKYQATSKMISLTDQHIQMSTVEKLRKYVRRYWMMAETGSPQLLMASNPLSTACGVICLIVFVMTLLTWSRFWLHFSKDINASYGSPYKWSTIAIYVIQTCGVFVGTAPIDRCFLAFNFNVGTRRNWNLFVNVEKYWTQKLHEWNVSHVHFSSSSRRSRRFIGNSIDIIVSLCIVFQKVIFVLCKVTWLITAVLVSIFRFLFSWMPLKARRLANPFIILTNYAIPEDLRNYVLQIEDEMELSNRTLKSISNSMNSFMMKAEREQNKNLLELLEKSTGFEGVEIFDTDQIQPLLSVELVNSWSLPIITLTCLAVALPSIHKDTVESLLISVGEGLSFTHLVEESLNSARKYVNIRMTTMILWHEVEHKCKWLDNPLAKDAFEGKTATEILKWFSDKAEEIVMEFKESTNGDLVNSPPKTLIAANSMYRVTQTILLRCQSNAEPITNKQLFAHLNGMIADIFSACFTNIPRVITTRCHESVIEKREESVKVAAKLLGKTTKIIERLETCEVPSMDDEKMGYIDEWRLYLKQSIP